MSNTYVTELTKIVCCLGTLAPPKPRPIHAKASKKSMKKRSERLKHCALAAVRRSRNFRPIATPFPGARGGQSLISWRYLYRVWWGSMHAISSYSGNKPTDRTDYKLSWIHRSCELYWADWNSLDVRDIPLFESRKSGRRPSRLDKFWADHWSDIVKSDYFFIEDSY